MTNIGKLFLEIPIKYSTKLDIDELYHHAESYLKTLEKKNKKKFFKWFTEITFRRKNKNIYRFGPNTWGSQSQLEIKIDGENNQLDIAIILFPKLWFWFILFYGAILFYHYFWGVFEISMFSIFMVGFFLIRLRSTIEGVVLLKKFEKLINIERIS